MASESLAKKVFKEARELYEAGFKSGNKRYDDDPRHVSWFKRVTGKAETRNETQDQASTSLGILRSKSGSILEYGKFMYDMHVPAANCGDLAQLSCYLATRHGVAANQLALVSVYTKITKFKQKCADHAFAVYGNATEIAELGDASLKWDMTLIQFKQALDSTVYAIDPWANLVCSLRRYPAKAEAKMRSWAAYGKRVLWCYSRTGAEWCKPDGEYLEVFKAASLRFHLAG